MRPGSRTDDLLYRINICGEDNLTIDCRNSQCAILVQIKEKGA